MKNTLIKDINEYITYLKSEGLWVSVHGRTISGLLEHNNHTNPFCIYVKTNEDAWKKCVKCQQKVFAAYNSDCIFGMCHAGVEEYVFYASPKVFVSVSGYAINYEKAADRISYLSSEYRINKNQLLNIYRRGLKHEKEDPNRLRLLIKPLCHMLSLLELTLGNIKDIEFKNKTFDSILAYIQKNIMQDIVIRDIADACACSESTVSHLFKEHMGISVKKYISDLRIKQAEKLVSTSDLPISSIALLCGFSNINYFSTAFKKQTGISPSDYRTIK